MTVECPSLCTHQSHHPKIQNVVTSMACPPRFVAAHSKIYSFLTNVPSRYLGDSILKLDVNVSSPLPCNSESKKLFQHDGIVASKPRIPKHNIDRDMSLSCPQSTIYKISLLICQLFYLIIQFQNDRRMTRCSPRLNDKHYKIKMNGGTTICASSALECRT
jgi:hypothetical protein